jgi:hypothetical protein
MGRFWIEPGGMIELSQEILDAFAVAKRYAVEPLKVFDLGSPHVAYWKNAKGRPGVVVRVQRDRHGVPVIAWLLYTTTKSVPDRHALELPAGEGGLREACRMDNRQYLRIDAATLEADGLALGQLGAGRRQDVEALVQSSRVLPKYVRGLPSS